MTIYEKRYTLDLDAHSIDDEFEQLIRKEYDVIITDRSGEPWSVVFEGTRSQLLAMVKNFWGSEIEIEDDDFSLVEPSH